MLFLLAGFAMYSVSSEPGGIYTDTYAIEVLPGDEPTLRGVEIAVDSDSIFETSGPSSIEGAAVTQDAPVKTQPTIDKIAV